jgi:hypothetical protein
MFSLCARSHMRLARIESRLVVFAARAALQMQSVLKKFLCLGCFSMIRGSNKTKSSYAE